MMLSSWFPDAPVAGMRALVIEDYTPIRTAVRDGLVDHGFAVDVADNGEDGLWMATQNPYDVIVLDVMLPKLDGLSVLRKLREGGSKVPVLLLTARDAVEERIGGLDLGADDYLVKPFAFLELLARLRALVRRRYDQTTPLLRAGDLTIDTAKRIVRRRDDLISLSPREYALLEYLAMRNGEIVTRIEIWEHVYDFHSEAHSNVVDVYISYLRKKLGPPPVIHTKRGYGYWFGVEP
jgi:DNA-binding response OmpR family regulator